MKVIDLSVPLYTGMTVFPGDPKVSINIVHTHDCHNWELREIKMGTHTGTHVDAYSHMHQGKESLDGLPLETFFGLSQVVNLSDQWPKKLGLFFLETIGIESARRIIDLKPKFIGGPISEELERCLLDHQIITYTGLINLDLIPNHKPFMFYGLPLKIQSADGSPVRAMAVIED